MTGKDRNNRNPPIGHRNSDAPGPLPFRAAGAGNAARRRRGARARAPPGRGRRPIEPLAAPRPPRSLTQQQQLYVLGRLYPVLLQVLLDLLAPGEGGPLLG